MINNPNIQAALRDLADNSVFILTNPTAPTNAVTGAGMMGKGSMIVDLSTGIWYSNTNTKASPTWTKIGTQT